MEYRFQDIDNDNMYNSCHVMYVLGGYDIFNNMVIDRLRSMAVPKELVETSSEYLNNFMADLVANDANETDSSAGMNTVSFNEFIELKGSYPMRGRWYCSVSYNELNSKQLESLNEYIKSSKGSGILVVSCREYKDYRNILKSRFIKNSKNVHMIQLSFPSRNKLSDIVSAKLNSGGVKANDKAIQLFIMRLSNAYDDYNKVLDGIIDTYKGKNIGYDEMLDSLRGIENYVLDDFIDQLTAGVKNRKIVKSRKIYRMLNSLLESMSAESLVKKLRNKVDILFELRRLINNGTIPVLVRYSATSIQDKLPDTSKVKSLSSKAFKRYSLIASKTSLEDWFLMSVILKGNNRCMSRIRGELEYRHILIELVHRTIASPERLMNDIGVKNVLDESLFNLNTVFYDTSIKLAPSKIEEILEKNRELVAIEDKKHKEEVYAQFKGAIRVKKVSKEKKYKPIKEENSAEEDIGEA